MGRSRPHRPYKHHLCYEPTKTHAVRHQSYGDGSSVEGGTTSSAMKKETLLIVVLLSVCGSGCRLAHNAWLTTIAEPLHYPRNLDDRLSHKRFTEMAEVALDEAVASAHAEMDNYECDPYSVDHRRGFVDGFVDYLDAGGIDGPPPLPPRKYWRGKFQNPFGHRRIEDWFEGYQHGVATARASNYRSFVVVPTGDAIVARTEQCTYGRISANDDANDEQELQRDAEFVDSTPKPRRLQVLPELSRVQPVSDVK